MSIWGAKGAPAPRVSGAKRPEYPSFLSVLTVYLKSCLWCTGFLGTVLVLTAYPLFKCSVTYLLGALGNNEALVFSIIFNACHTLVWCLVNLPLLFFDYNNMMQEYKLHRTVGQIPSDKKIRENIITSLVMQFIVNPLSGYYIFEYFQKWGMLSVTADLPAVGAIIKTLLISHLFENIMFYITHRLFHTKALYWLHKQHHTFAGTIGPAAEYANPIEFIIAKYLSIIKIRRIVK